VYYRFKSFLHLRYDFKNDFEIEYYNGFHSINKRYNTYLKLFLIQVNVRLQIVIEYRFQDKTKHRLRFCFPELGK
jgi:hypothetical protein